MPYPLLLPTLLLLIGALAGPIYYSVIIVRTWLASRSLPTAHNGISLPDPDEWPALDIVIPAHNEQDVIADLVTSLRAQSYPDFAAWLVLDRCTDDTETVARRAVADDARFFLISNLDCPDGWAGKT
ncbi:MAG: glycosyltransferase, partial [Phycisphaerales bacterium]|nr:glycosyltransferase [Phycisphaerales bacterium]